MNSLAGPSTQVWVERLANRKEPLLTWYSTGRVELAGPVLARWLAKVDNYLDAEFPFGAATFHLHLPECWQKIVWEAALALRGWEAGPADQVELVISDDLELLTAAADAGLTAIAQPTDPLALSWPGELPAGVSDAPGELNSQADQPLASLPDGPLWPVENNLLAGLPVPPGRVFVQHPEVGKLLQLWWHGGSALVIDNWADDRERTRSLMDQEQAEQVLA
ncbi:hypothetical protein VRY54_07390 [Actinomyces sp. F1_1611]